mmetsp:Transcript_7030/g.25432  ORF Transcript_7030/g.25432 Transcript_7030/m.25432 type:complete len:283 (+) Transcript_7030:911-1759(+)
MRGDELVYTVCSNSIMVLMQNRSHAQVTLPSRVVRGVALKYFLNVLDSERLGNPVREALDEALLLGLCEGIRRHCDDLGADLVSIPLLELLHDLHSALSRHVQVHEDHVEGVRPSLGLDLLQRNDPVFRCGDICKAKAGQDSEAHLHVDDVVLGNQNPALLVLDRLRAAHLLLHVALHDLVHGKQPLGAAELLQGALQPAVPDRPLHAEVGKSAQVVLQRGLQVLRGVADAVDLVRGRPHNEGDGDVSLLLHQCLHQALAVLVHDDEVEEDVVHSPAAWPPR